MNEMKSGVIIKNGTVVTMDKHRRIIDKGIVVVEGSIITEVGSEVCIKKYPDFKVIDAENGIVLPGLINTHSHLPMIAFRGLGENGIKDRLFDLIFPLEKNMLSRELIYNATIHGAIEYAMSGITTFVDMYYHTDEMAKAIKKVGIRAVLGETIIRFPVVDAPKPYGGLDYGIDLIKKYKNDPLVVPALAPHAPYSVSKEKLLETQSLSSEYKTPILIHVSERTDEPMRLPEEYKGKSSIYYLNNIGFLKKNVHLAHAIYLDDKDIEIIKNIKCGVAHNPVANAKSGHGIARAFDMKKAGVRMGIGTDGPMSCNSLNLFETMRGVAMMQRAQYKNATLMKPIEIVEMATIGGAESLQMEDKIGSLEKGKFADIIVIETKSPNMVPCYDYYAALVFQAQPFNVVTTVINGEIVMENRKLQTFNVEDDHEIMKHIEQKIRPFAKELEARSIKYS